MSNLIVKDNALINASYNLDLVEQRLILLAIAEARESGKGINANDPLTIHSESYINQFEVHRTTAYQALKDACKSLFARQFSYQIILPSGKIHHKTTRWVSEIGYVEQDATVDLIFSPAVVPLITRLEKHFTNYEIQQVSKLSSAYAVRMYELLICWRSTGKTPIIELEDFRKRIGVLDTEYQRTDNLKMRVIEQSIKQINQHTDITASYEQHKKGRVITGFSFKFKQKKQHKKEIKDVNRDHNTPDFFINMTDAQRHLFAHKLSEIPEMSKYSKGTESYDCFAKRIADMLLIPEKLRELYPMLEKVGFNA